MNMRNNKGRATTLNSVMRTCILPFPLDWPVSLRPDYLIEEVEVVCEQVTESTGDPVLRFTCQFHSVPDKLYTVVW